MRSRSRDDSTAGEDSTAGDYPTGGDDPSVATEDHPLEPSPFPHPPWTVGLVLVGGVITLLFGILVSPIWLLVGSPFVITLLLWLYVRLIVRPDDRGC